MPLAELTHPIYAALDHPLFCKQKRGLGEFYNNISTDILHLWRIFVVLAL